MIDLEGRVRVFHSDDGERSRGMVLIRILALIPHLIWFSIWSFGALIVLPLHWIVALFRGRSMEWSHRFYSAFVVYALNLYAYWFLAADRYPPFQGETDYVVGAEMPTLQPQRRWKIALRLLLALPALVLAGALSNGFGGGASGGGTGSDDVETQVSLNFGLGFAIAFLAWFVSLARGRTPQGLRDAQVYCLGYAAQAYAYLFLLTERYPTSDPRAVALEPMPPHPVRLPEPDDDRSRNRLVVFFRVLLTIPHFVWLVLWGIAVFLAALVGWLAALFTGRLPRPLHDFIAAYVRYWAHVTAFLYLVGGPFPGFLGRAGSYPVDPVIDPPERQSRWKTLFRWFLAIPGFLLGSAFSTVMFVAGVGAWWAALITGRVPEGLHRLLAWAVRYAVQLYSYLLLLTEHYPYTGPDGTGRTVEAEPMTPVTESL